MIGKDAVAVVLELDVAARFSPPKAVNALVGSVLSAIPDARQNLG